ncbi:family A G protein-coupled receptor-like protein [Tothia fuscella]|uniref:Family A G protein-coupled receptor-like protein n=1 Tax=Tothia fuscella TaxID=1048955 RepID=A0A9P4NMN5_9PEZI|nr:family A G protein-coupled receptor-like protein [Tothia fuscella]
MDPVEIMKKTTSLLVPTSTSTVPGATNFPTVLPDKPIYEHATASGTRTLWVVFVIMLISAAAFTAMSWRIPVSKRLYHILTTLITIIAAISYFGMATKHGVNYNHTRKTESHKHVPDTHQEIYREVYWARYVDWSLTTPLLLLDLCFLAGISGAHIFMAVLADLVMILTGLFAAYGGERSGQKWGWYTIACIAFLVIIWHLVVNGRITAQAKGSKVGKFFAAISLYTILIWTAYPIIWGVADGSRILSVNQEIMAYAILDVLAKPVFGFWLLFTHAKLPETGVELGGFWTHGLGSEGRLRVGDDDEGA